MILQERRCPRCAIHRTQAPSTGVDTRVLALLTDLS
jgi:hypothetical protein